jgi:hypothetical protein
MPKQSAALHVTAEPGKAYFFTVRNRWNHVTGPTPTKLEAVDSDEGKLLIGTFAHATWQPKK